MKALTFTQHLFREGKAIIAYCSELDISSCGDTQEQAQANLRTAIRLFLEESANLGTLDDILIEAGYNTEDAVLSSPMIATTQCTLSLEGLSI